MQTSVSRNEFRTTGNKGIVYRTVCQNRGCLFKFDLRITIPCARACLEYGNVSW
jgi:hypothetical protein